ncbi:MAG: hypothetical protein KID09_15250 [Paenibacillus macerans]|nr:hypothetical protein [Paenibacillus macerans]GBK69323.1 hypothetical protein PbJCM17693_30310 [Paenibacillus macerans]
MPPEIAVKNAVIPAVSLYMKEIKVIDAPICPDCRALPAFWPFHWKIGAKNAANDEDHANLRIIST